MDLGEIYDFRLTVTVNLLLRHLPSQLILTHRTAEQGQVSGPSNQLTTTYIYICTVSSMKSIWICIQIVMGTSTYQCLCICCLSYSICWDMQLFAEASQRTKASDALMTRVYTPLLTKQSQTRPTRTSRGLMNLLVSRSALQLLHASEITVGTKESTGKLSWKTRRKWD